MIKLKTLLSLLFIAVTAISCELENKKSDKGWNLVLRDGLLYSDSLTIEPFTGHYKGKVMGKSIEYDVVDGKRNGIFILYNENGYVETFGYLKDNKNHGEWKYYYPNGELESVGIFYDDKPDSLWNWFYMNGKILQEGW
ncbi:MAG TPA: hypothetical protein VK870_02635, partial [Ignavibacteriaceae bacterium]|nr:hypothetical protein [Ignavibacteriaceae bacterium]